MKPLFDGWDGEAHKLLPPVVDWFPAMRSPTADRGAGHAEIMLDPVRVDAVCGCTASRHAARMWFEVHGGSSCPACGHSDCNTSVRSFKDAGTRKLDMVYQFARAMPYMFPQSTAVDLIDFDVREDSAANEYTKKQKARK